VSLLVDLQTEDGGVTLPVKAEAYLHQCLDVRRCDGDCSLPPAALKVALVNIIGIGIDAETSLGCLKDRTKRKPLIRASEYSTNTLPYESSYLFATRSEGSDSAI